MLFEDIDFDNISQYKSIFSLPSEVWKDIEDYGGRYQVSDLGRVRSQKYYDSIGRLKGGIIFNTADNGGGYRYLVLTHPVTRKTKNVYMHRLVALYFHENPDNLPQVNHMPDGFGKHDNRACVIEWCTGKHNIIDAHKNGQMKNRTENAQLDRKSNEFIAEMYWEYKRSGKVGKTARMFGVARTTLSSIVNKRSRRNITDPIDLEYKLKGEK